MHTNEKSGSRCLNSFWERLVNLTQIWNDQEINLLKHYYPTHRRSELIALFPNRTYPAIQRMASYLGIEKIQRDFIATPEIRARMSKAHIGIKLSEHHRTALRRCTLNESAFDILTEQSVYWIGFLHTDGNVCYKKGIPIVALHLKDIDLQHLLKFRDFVGSSHKIGHYVNKVWGNASNSISFSSERIANVLAKYGCVPRKCFNAEIIGGIENNRHVWRGVIDGDGSLGIHIRKDTGRRVPYISLTGSKSVCLQFRTFLEKELGEPMPPNVISYKRSYLFMVSDHRAVKAIKLLYNNCTIALERKLRRAIEILNESRVDSEDKCDLYA